MTENFVAYRLLIDYPLIIGNNQRLLYITDYLSITHRLHIDVIDFIDEICLELLHIGILATGSSLMTYFTGTRSNDEYKFTPIEARSNYSKYSFFHRFFFGLKHYPVGFIPTSSLYSLV